MIKFWAGSEESYKYILEAQAKVEAMMAQPGMTAGYMDDMVSKLPPIWRHEGSTAVVEISGGVVQGSSGWLRLYGVLGYDDIGRAAVEAAMHENTERMLYHINSPGGDVAGVIDAGQLLSTLSAMKPSAVHTTEQLASAGYWLATSVQGPITTGPTAVVGSIGVLQVHREQSKMMEEIGIKTTVLRSGEYKAEMNSLEPLSEGAKGRAEQQLADVHGLFRAHVGRGRPNLSSEDLADVTRGQTFLGKRAVTAGLADKVGSFALALKLLDKQKHPRDTSPNSKGKTMKLTPEQLAKIAGGATMASLNLHDDGTPFSAEEISAAATAADAAKLKAEADEAARIAAEKPAPVVAAVDTGVVDLLKAQLVSAQATATQASAELIALKASTQSQAAEHAELLTIAREATARMLIPMGGTRAAIDGMAAAGVIAEHSRLTPIFAASFKVGRVSQPAAAEDGKPAIDPQFLARVAAQAKTK